MTRGLSFAFVFLIAGYAFSQSCTQKLNRAEDYYDAGRLLEIDDLISACLRDGAFTEGEEIRARKLLTRVAIFTDNEPKAEEELIGLLQVDPLQYRIQPDDPSEFRVLMDKFRTWPIYRIEAYGGVNLSTMGTTGMAQEFSAFPGQNTSKEYNTSISPGIQGGVRITKHLKDLVYGVEVGGGFEFRSSSYNVKSTPTVGTFETNITNSQSTLRIPLFVRYNFRPDVDAKFDPYVFFGGSFDLILKAQYSDGNRIGGTSFNIDQGADLLSYGQVSKTNASMLVGAGVKLGMKKGNFLFAEVRFDKGLFLYNVPSERYVNTEVSSDLQFVEDDVYLDMLGVNVGLVFSIFKPQKLVK